MLIQGICVVYKLINDNQRRTNSYEILVRVEVSAGLKYHIETLYLQSGLDRSTPVYFSMLLTFRQAG